MSKNINLVRDAIRDVPDFPKKGIVFKDITPILQDPDLLRISVDILYDVCKDEDIDYVCGIESRGFIFGAALALRLNAGFVPVRKPGKLPADTFTREYELEYGINALEVHRDAFHPGANVLIIDDLLATGGTAAAAAHLVEQCGAKVEHILFLIELSFLNGQKAIEKYPVTSLIKYNS